MFEFDLIPDFFRREVRSKFGFWKHFLEIGRFGILMKKSRGSEDLGSTLTTNLEIMACYV